MAAVIEVNYERSMKPTVSKPPMSSQNHSSSNASSTSAQAEVLSHKLSLCLGALANIATSLRIISNSMLTGSRRSVKKSIEALQNTEADEDESGQ
jgi:hypothetical protein